MPLTIHSHIHNTDRMPVNITDLLFTKASWDTFNLQFHSEQTVRLYLCVVRLCINVLEPPSHCLPFLHPPSPPPFLLSWVPPPFPRGSGDGTAALFEKDGFHASRCQLCRHHFCPVVVQVHLYKLFFSHFLSHNICPCLTKTA